MRKVSRRFQLTSRPRPYRHMRSSSMARTSEISTLNGHGPLRATWSNRRTPRPVLLFPHRQLEARSASWRRSFTGSQINLDTNQKSAIPMPSTFRRIAALKPPAGRAFGSHILPRNGLGNSGWLRLVLCHASVVASVLLYGAMGRVLYGRFAALLRTSGCHGNQLWLGRV